MHAPLSHELRAVSVEIAQRRNLIYPFFGSISIAVNSQNQETKMVDIYIYIYIYIYTGCHRRNGPNFARVFLMLNYTDITKNTYIQS